MASLLAAITFVTTIAVAPVDEREELFAWFDTLGFTEIATGEFVRVDRFEDAAGKPVSTEYAFLKKDWSHKDSYRMLGLFVEGPSTDGWIIKHRPANFTTWLSQALGRKVAVDAFSRDPYSAHRLRGLEWFVASRAAAARGADSLSRQAYVRYASDFGSSHSRRPSTQDLAEEIARVMSHLAVRTLSTPSIPRTEVLRQFRFVGERFPDTDQHEGAVAAVKMLEMMVREDAEHVPPSQPLSKLPMKERVAELIFRLRDLHAYSMFHPGRSSVLGRPYIKQASKNPNAGHELVAIGFPAVPQLIEALDDPRYVRGLSNTRAIDVRSAMTVGAAAAEILSVITGQDFDEDPQTDVSRIGARKERATEWWKAVQRRGLQNVLVEGVKSGGRAAGSQAEVLLKLYPSSVLPAIVKGVAQQQEPWSRSKLIEVLGKISDPDAARVAKRLMVTAPELESRLEAAQIVYKIDPAAAAIAMGREWRKLASGVGRVNVPDRWEISELIDFLTRSGQSEAIAALAHRIDLQATDTRTRIVYLLDVSRAPKAEKPRLLRAAEQFLVGRLLDEGWTPGYSLTVASKDFELPEVGDLACYKLAQVWPKKYRFVNTESPLERKITRIKALNVWRRERGMRMLPLPMRPTARVSRPQTLRWTHTWP